MRHIVFEESDSYPIAILIKDSALNRGSIQRYYIKPLEDLGIPKRDIVAISLAYNDKGKAPKAFIDEYLDELLPALHSIGTKYVFCADAAYFKVLAKQDKPSARLGYVDPCVIKGYEDLEILSGVNYSALVYNPAQQEKLDLSLTALSNVYNSTYKELGADIIHHAEYPKTIQDISKALDKLHQHPRLFADIETFSLKFNEAGIGTITFCWSEHEGIAFLCDYSPLPVKSNKGHYGEYVANQEVRALIKQFLEEYQGELVWHRANYDTKVLIATLWMENLLDRKGMLDGLEVLFPKNKVHDTRIIAYLAINNTYKNTLDLKDLAQEFAGDWAQSGEEIKNIRIIPADKLLEYNLVDGLSTGYVFNKYYPIMVEDEQEELYYSLMMPSQKVIVQTELVGMPLNPTRVQEVKTILENEKQRATNVLNGVNEDGTVNEAVNKYIQKHLLRLREDAMKAANAKLKIKQHPLSAFSHIQFNPGSSLQCAKLLHDVLGLPVIDRTPTKAPSTSGKTISKLLNRTKDEGTIAILEALLLYAEVTKILDSFIPAFEDEVDKGDGVVYLHGNFNLGGTKSGRLSSSDPNLQNIPSNSTYGALIKSCFQAPDGYLFGGADFNSLEDMVSALTTKDPNKLKVYEDKFDGHSLRAVYYFPEELGHISPDSPEEVNSLKEQDHPLRQESKTPTFLLTYRGTYHGLMNSLGWSEEKAKQVESNYHEMYKVSDKWVQDKLDEAAVRGYVVVAFGLRLRTPLLAKTIRGHSTTPYAAMKESRTAGNALGQSYGLLNNRALNEFMEKVWDSPYKYQIMPVAMIHDAIYLLFPDDLEILHWINKELIKSMQWQELPELKHDTVKLGAELDIFYPTWADELTIPNNATPEEIQTICEEYISAM